MNLKTSVGTILLLTCIVAFSQDNAFKLYNTKGKEVKYDKMIESLNEADIIFFGEYHTNPISHWLQYEVTKSISEKNKITVGAEMFERDNQDELNAFLNDSIDFAALDSTARLWNNYKTDYAPLVDLAKEKNSKFIATNIPRRNAKIVYRHGFEGLDTLSEEEKTYNNDAGLGGQSNVSGKHLRSCYVDGGTTTTDRDTCNKQKLSEIISS